MLCFGCRAYGIYVADVNADGYLDVLVLNQMRNAPPIVPSRLFISRGAAEPRMYDLEPAIDQHATSAILTDFDQDGFASELVVLRTGLVAASESPVSVYKWDSSTAVRDLTPHTGAVGWDLSMGSKDGAKSLGFDRASIQTGDFNGDSLVDLAILNPRNKLCFYYSRPPSTTLRRSVIPQGQTSSAISETISLSQFGCEGLMLLAADYDLDSTLDLLVVCKKPGTSLLLTKMSGSWERMEHESDDDVLSKAASHHNSSFVRWCCSSREACSCKTGMQAQTFGIVTLCDRDRGISKIAGSSAFDFNNDGYMDLAFCVRGERCHLFQNQWAAATVPPHSYTAFQLKGVESNTYGIGATVILTWADGSGMEREQLRELNAVSNGPMGRGSSDHRLIFGLGTSGKPLKVVVRWPSRIVDTHENANELRSRSNTMEIAGPGRRMLTLEEGGRSW